MFLDILSSLSLVVVTNLHPKKKTQEKALTEEQGHFSFFFFFFLLKNYIYINCCFLLSGRELEIVYVEKRCRKLI